MRILRKLNTKNLMKSDMETDIEITSRFEEYYMNQMQILVNVIDANNIFAEVARAGGKTEGITGPRIIRVANDMPGELSFLVHKTYVALMTNVWPNLQAYFSREEIGRAHV